MHALQSRAVLYPVTSIVFCSSTWHNFIIDTYFVAAFHITDDPKCISENNQLQCIAGSRGRRRRAPPYGPDSFVLTYKFFET